MAGRSAPLVDSKDDEDKWEVREGAMNTRRMGESGEVADC